MSKLATKKQPTCKELVRDKFNEVEQAYQEANDYYNDYHYYDLFK